jgi:hypothetical protein
MFTGGLLEGNDWQASAKAKSCILCFTTLCLPPENFQVCIILRFQQNFLHVCCSPSPLSHLPSTDPLRFLEERIRITHPEARIRMMSSINGGGDGLSKLISDLSLKLHNLQAEMENSDGVAS